MCTSCNRSHNLALSPLRSFAIAQLVLSPLRSFAIAHLQTLRNRSFADASQSLFGLPLLTCPSPVFLDFVSLLYSPLFCLPRFSYFLSYLAFFSLSFSSRASISAA